MEIEFNKVTWYSKFLAVIVFIAALILAFYLGGQFEKMQTTQESVIIRNVPVEEVFIRDNEITYPEDTPTAWSTFTNYINVSDGKTMSYIEKHLRFVGLDSSIDSLYLPDGDQQRLEYDLLLFDRSGESYPVRRQVFLLNGSIVDDTTEDVKGGGVKFGGFPEVVTGLYGHQESLQLAIDDSKCRLTTSHNIDDIQINTTIFYNTIEHSVYLHKGNSSIQCTVNPVTGAVTYSGTTMAL